MPNIDKECSGEGATHRFACKCREDKIKELAIRATQVRLLLHENICEKITGECLNTCKLLKEALIYFVEKKGD